MAVLLLENLIVSEAALPFFVFSFFVCNSFWTNSNPFGGHACF